LECEGIFIYRQGLLRAPGNVDQPQATLPRRCDGDQDDAAFEHTVSMSMMH